MTFFRGRLAARYIFVEMLPGFFMGVCVFIFLLLMLQILRLTEFVVVHGNFQAAIEIIFYLSISFLPAVLPMAILFAVLLSFTRLSGDSEIVAFKATGLHMGHLTTPPVLLGIIVAIFSAQISFNTAPWGNRQFELLISKLGSSTAASTIREGTFSEGFFDLVMYAKKVDSKKNILTDVFIYDEREADNPVTIIAKTGQILPSEQGTQGALLRLTNGNIHHTAKDTYTKINFEAYDINLSRPTNEAYSEKSTLSLTLSEIEKLLENKSLPKDKVRTLESEYHKRWAISVACILFAFLGVGLGTVTHKRSVKSGSLIISLGVIIVYWAMYVIGDNIARAGVAPAWITIWAANIFFSFLGIWLLKRSWN